MTRSACLWLTGTWIALRGRLCRPPERPVCQSRSCSRLISGANHKAVPSEDCLRHEWLSCFLSKVEHEASLCLPSLDFSKRLVPLFKFAYFRDDLGFSCRLKLKRLSQIDSIPQSRSHYFDIARHDVKNRQLHVLVSGKPDEHGGPAATKRPEGLFKCFWGNGHANCEICSTQFLDLFDRVSLRCIDSIRGAKLFGE